MVPMISYSQLYREASSHLERAGILQPQQEALWIVEAGLGVKRAQLFANMEHGLESERYEKILALIRRRALREPLQYILGTQDFCGYEMKVNSDVLIPRVETELLVEEVVHRLEAKGAHFILDVGTGSGCIAISLARAFPGSYIVAVDRSQGALAVARENATRHGVSHQIFFLAGDLLAPLLSRGLAGKVTAIVANLPYISHAEWEDLPPDVKSFEPRVALDGGWDGLECYRRLLQETPHLLSPDGVLLMETGLGQAETLCEEVLKVPGFQVNTVISDHQAIPRIVCVKKPKT